MTGRDAGDDPEDTGADTSYGAFALALHNAFHEARLHSPQGITGVEERLRGKLNSHSVTLTTDVLRALAFAIVNDRGP